MRNSPLNREFLYRFMVAFARFMPFPALRALSAPLALINYAVLREARGNVQSNLARLFADRSRVRAVARRIFFNYAEYIADWSKLMHLEPQNILDLFSFAEGRESVDRAIAAGRGTILLTAHLGNWELGGLFFSHMGARINVITAQDEDRAVAAVRERTRLLHDVNTITIGPDRPFFVEIVNALKRNEIVAMLVDRYGGDNAVPIDFFGAPAMFPVGPIHMASATGAAVLPAFIVSDGSGGYKAIAENLIDIERTGDRDADVRNSLRKIVRVLERRILEYPDQWYNFTPLWPSQADAQRSRITA